jgi:hypothetical protein
MGSQKLRINQIACQHEKRKPRDDSDAAYARTSACKRRERAATCDPQIVADAKIALWEAQELSALYSVALTKESEELRKRTVNASSMRASERT